MHLHYARGGLEMARGRHAGAIAAFRAARRLAETLVSPHSLIKPLRAHMLQALVLGGETGRRNARSPRWMRANVRVARCATPSPCSGLPSTTR